MTGTDSSGRGGGRLDWREVKLLYLRELRAAFREKAIVINSVLIPVFLYPFIMWAAFTGLVFVHGQTEGFVSRTLVREWPRAHPALRGAFERDRQIQLADFNGARQDVENQIREGKLDVFVEFLPAEAAEAALAGNFQVRVTFNESKERSDSARKRVTGVMDDYRETWLKREARQRGADSAAWQGFTISTSNVATKKQMGSFVLGLMLPILFVVMVAVGCFYPAVDATAGERERNTWETLMTTAASRVSIVTAKYLYVATLGGLAGVLNLAAMALTMKPVFAPLMAKTGDVINFSIPFAAAPVLLLAAVLLAGFVAAGMMIFAAFARTFKEGQAMITPFYLVIILPILFLQTPGIKLTLPLACVPIVNVTLMVRAAVSGVFPWLPIVVTVLVSLALIALCVRLAAYVLRFEDVMLGSYGGSLGRFLKERLGRRKIPVVKGVQ